MNIVCIYLSLILELLSQQRKLIMHWELTSPYYVYRQHTLQPRGINIPKEESTGSVLGAWVSLFFFFVSRISYLAQNETRHLAHQLSTVLTFKQSFSLLSLLAECALSQCIDSGQTMNLIYFVPSSALCVSLNSLSPSAEPSALESANANMQTPV